MTVTLAFAASLAAVWGIAVSCTATGTGGVSIGARAACATSKAG
ncbi:hypothetical protein [Paraburkholderia terrae]|nr:hypothetical protein [Paraburkholderia terrae]